MGILCEPPHEPQSLALTVTDDIQNIICFAKNTFSFNFMCLWSSYVASTDLFSYP